MLVKTGRAKVSWSPYAQASTITGIKHGTPLRLNPSLGDGSSAPAGDLACHLALPIGRVWHSGKTCHPLEPLLGRDWVGHYERTPCTLGVEGTVPVRAPWLVPRRSP